MNQALAAIDNFYRSSATRPATQSVMSPSQPRSHSHYLRESRSSPFCTFRLILAVPDYRNLNRTATNTMVHNVLIQEHYDDILRVAGSLLQRATTAWEPMRALRSRTHLPATLGRGDRAGRSSEDQDALVSACVGQRGVRSSP